MPLTASEIRVGAVAYFDVENLHENPEVTFSGDRVTRDSKGNQFVCYNVDGDQSFQAPLTATFRKERLKIDAAWTVNGYGPFGKGQVYLQDGKNTYKGRNEAFVKAAERETPFFGARPAISSVGIGEILKVIGQRRGQLA